ncbi:MAG: hypothetical protein M3423_06400, partial [Actinomycetota bacterium]|nr:hypothetical protein [Actinomycetota bacterium]
MSALILRSQLVDLQAEKALATVEGLDASVAYMADLEDLLQTGRGPDHISHRLWRTHYARQDEAKTHQRPTR